MKKLLWLLAIGTICGVFQAQTQELPDMRIIGESGVKAYLYKRALLFSPVYGVGDSLPAFLPNGVLRPIPKSPNKEMKHRSYLQLEVNSGLGAGSYFSLYPKSDHFTGVSHHLQLKSPDSRWTSLQNNLFVGMKPIRELPLSLRVVQQSATSPGFNSQNVDVSMAHYRPQWQLSENTKISDMNLQIGYNRLLQKKMGIESLIQYPAYHVSGQFGSKWLDLKMKALGSTGETGLQIAPGLGTAPFDIQNLRLHVLADAYHLIPSIEFSYRDPMTNGGVFSLSNTPLLQNNSFSSMLEENQWQSLDLQHRIQKVPLNLTAGLEFVFPRQNDFSLSRLQLYSNVRYSLSYPIADTSQVYGVAEPHYCDYVSNLSTVQGFFRMGDFILHQSVDMELAYLNAEAYRRVPYKPALILLSRFSYPYHAWLFGFDIDQRYFSIDHRGKDLSEYIGLNLRTEYRRGNSSLYGQIDDILNQKRWLFSEQKPQRFTLYLGMKHRF
ncbi:hypothetical protein MASR1M36_12930 [Candidatus Cloacimonadaceae bacterium]